MDKYKFIKRLGYTTWLVEDKIGQKLALKQVECIDEIEANKIFNEMASLQSLKHPLIIPYHHLFVSWDKERAVHLCIVTRYISHGNLKDFLISCRASKQLVNETLLKKWIGQLTEGLARLHFYHYNHRRLKTSNIYINKDNSLCIGDIGTSLKSSISLNVMNWLSPEAVESTEYDERFDMWSLGCVILELVTTSFLTDSEFIATLYQLKINTDILAKILQKVSQIYDNDIAHLIQSLIRTNYHQRPLAIEVCDTPFILDCMSLYESSLLQELKNPVDEQDSFISKVTTRGSLISLLVKMMKCKYAIDSQVAILEDFIRLIQDNNQTDKFILKKPCKELLYHTVQVNLTYPELVSKCFLMMYMGSGTNNVSTFISDKLLTGLSITAIKIHSNDISVITEATKVLLALSTKGSQIRMVLVNERIVHTSIEVIRRFPQQPNILTLNFILLLNILCEQSIILQTAVSEGLVSVVCLALRDHQHSSLVVGPALSLLWASSSSDDAVADMCVCHAHILISHSMHSFDKDVNIVKFGLAVLTNLCNVRDEVVYSLLDVKHDPVPLSGIVSSIRHFSKFKDIIHQYVCLLKLLTKYTEVSDELIRMNVAESLTICLNDLSIDKELRDDLQSLALLLSS